MRCLLLLHRTEQRCVSYAQSRALSHARAAAPPTDRGSGAGVGQGDIGAGMGLGMGMGTSTGLDMHMGVDMPPAFEHAVARVSAVLSHRETTSCTLHPVYFTGRARGPGPLAKERMAMGM